MDQERKRPVSLTVEHPPTLLQLLTENRKGMNELRPQGLEHQERRRQREGDKSIRPEGLSGGCEGDLALPRWPSGLIRLIWLASSSFLTTPSVSLSKQQPSWKRGLESPNKSSRMIWWS